MLCFQSRGKPAAWVYDRKRTRRVRMTGRYQDDNLEGERFGQLMLQLGCAGSNMVSGLITAGSAVDQVAQMGTVRGWLWPCFIWHLFRCDEWIYSSVTV